MSIKLHAKEAVLALALANNGVVIRSASPRASSSIVSGGNEDKLTVPTNRSVVKALCHMFASDAICTMWLLPVLSTNC